MTYFLAHAGDDHASTPLIAAETNKADMLLPIIIITIVSAAALAAVAVFLSRKGKSDDKSRGQDETE